LDRLTILKIIEKTSTFPSLKRGFRKTTLNSGVKADELRSRTVVKPAEIKPADG